MGRKMRLALVAVAVCAVALALAVLVLWRPWPGSVGLIDYVAWHAGAGAGGSAEPPAEGIEALLPEGIEVVSPGPSIDDFPSEAEWRDYWAHWHEDEVAMKHGSPIVRDARTGKQYIPGEAVLFVDSGMGDAEIGEMVELRGLHVAQITRSPGLSTLVKVYSGDIAADVGEMGRRFEGLDGVQVGGANAAGNALDALAGDPVGGVRAGSGDGAAGLPSEDDPLSGEQVYLASSGFVDAWEETTCDGSVTIAVLDTPIDHAHEDLMGPLGDAGEDRLHPGAYGHGTAVAGIACAEVGNGIGIAGCSHNAELIDIPAAAPDGTSSFSAMFGAFSSAHARSDKPDVACMSLSLPASIFTEVEKVQLGIVVATLSEADGCVVVASTGNCEPEGNELRYPAACQHVIGVGAVMPSGSHMAGYVSNSTVDVCALGELVYTTTDPTAELGGGGLYADRYEKDGEVRKVSGTSYAAPQVASAAALVKAKHPTWSPSLIEKAIEKTATRPTGMGAAERTDAYGYGALDAYGAVKWTPSTGGFSPFTGPGDDVEALDAQVDAQKRLQATGASGIPGALAAAMDANPDVFAWLYVPATNLSLPVAVRGRGDPFYLDHGACGEPNVFGCAFSGGGSRDMTDPVTVVYGRSFSDVGLAFTELHKFEDYAFFAGHEKVYLYLPGRRLEYRVAGANLFNARAIEGVDQSDAADLGDYFAELSNPDQAAFVGFKRRFSLDPAPDRVLQLSTCTAPADPARRFVVTCVLEGEREL